MHHGFKNHGHGLQEKINVQKHFVFLLENSVQTSVHVARGWEGVLLMYWVLRVCGADRVYLFHKFMDGRGIQKMQLDVGSEPTLRYAYVTCIHLNFGKAYTLTH